MGKLVRDRIPEIIEASGRIADVRTLSPSEYRGALLDKLFEEAQELRDADEKGEVEELADVYEVVRALAGVMGLTMTVLEGVAREKRQNRGGFENRVWLN